jgi:hypothetical protein
MPDMVTNTRSGIGAAGSSTQPSTALLGGFRASSTGAPGAGWLSAVRAGPPRRRRLFRRLQVSLRAVGQGGETIIPAQQRIADVSDEMELDEVYATERQLLYVAARNTNWPSGLDQRNHNPEVAGSSPAPATNQMKSMT